MKEREKICVLASGGTDSAVLMARLAETHHIVYPVYVRQGLRWEKAELHWLGKYLRAIKNRYIKPLTILDATTEDVYDNHWSLSGKNVPGKSSPDEDVYLPGRNILLLSKASVWCSESGIHHIALGCLSGNPFPDSTPAFFRKMSQALTQGLRHKIFVSALFLRYSKQDVLKLGSRLPLHLTFSCLNPKGMKPCRVCNKCAEREKAFSQ